MRCRSLASGCFLLAVACEPTPQQQAPPPPAPLTDAGVPADRTCERALPAGYAADDCEVPHRVQAVSCDDGEPTPCSVEDNVRVGECNDSADCADGSCVDFIEQCFCGSNTCVSDADCGESFACACGGFLGFAVNACVFAECRTDADCPTTNRCVLAALPALCACEFRERQWRFVCKRLNDECETDDDCAADQVCQFDQAQGRLRCSVAAGCYCDG